MRVASKEVFKDHIKEKKITLSKYYTYVSRLSVLSYFLTLVAIGVFYYTQYEAVASLSTTTLWVVVCSFFAFLASKKLDIISNNYASLEDSLPDVLEEDFIDYYTKIVDDMCEVVLYLVSTALLVLATLVSLITAIWG